MTATQQESINRQEELRAFVNREVVYCVSTLVYELAQKEEYMDDLMPILSQEDYQTAAEDAGYTVLEDEENDGYYYTTNDETPGPEPTYYDTEQEAWRAACEDNDIEPYTTEAYEHWIVSDWFARKLEQHGEMILHDFMGLTLWGRTCTGQAIFLDNVIAEIYDDLK